MTAHWVVRLPTWLGDTLMALPALRGIARLTDAPPLLWGPPQLAGLLTHAGFAFDYLPYRRRRGAAGISDALHVCAELRYRQPAAALLLPNAFEPALLARVAGIPRRIGYATDGRGALLNDAVEEPRPRHAVHEAERFARLARHAGATLDPHDGALVVDDALRERGAALLPGGRARLGLAPGSANTPAKRWPAARYVELARAARDAFDAEIVLLGSDAERAANAEIAAACGEGTVDLTGCSLSDLAAAMLRCRVVVGNDSGATHLAVALDRSTVVLFGPTDPRRSAPAGENVHIVQAGVFCQPCGYRRCPLDHRCMLRLEPGAVLEPVAASWERAT